MRICVLFVFVLSAALSCVAVPTVTNSVSSAVFVTVGTNAPAGKVSRRQCEAVTKSGNRCKRNSIPGGKLCLQHKRISDRK